MGGHRTLRAVVPALLLAFAWPAPAPAQEVAQQVLATHTLRVGTVLEAGDLRAKGGDDASGRALIAAMVGLETRRAIYTGRPVVAADLGPPTLVRRNAVVVMLYSNRGLGIRTEGRALESGGAGEVVRVLNLTSRRSVMATVTGENRVEVYR
ncbi:MAG: flagellar basal body P-ring formation protein FlgA [Proteobacteria bacterium]|nr:flagellar basal body P-ring formation protein FlgA [Pseudomonadota bacterium]